jgi:type II secretory pathway component GspD/PulD (secretin)
MEQFKINGRDSTLQTTLPATDAADMIKTLRTTEGVTILSEPRVSTFEGQEGRMFVGSADPNGRISNYSVGLTPNISTDGNVVDLSVNAQVDPPANPAAAGQ